MNPDNGQVKLIDFGIASPFNNKENLFQNLNVVVACWNVDSKNYSSKDECDGYKQGIKFVTVDPETHSPIPEPLFSLWQQQRLVLKV